MSVLCRPCFHLAHLAGVIPVRGERYITFEHPYGRSWLYLMAQGPAVLRYLKLALWPQPLVLDYGFCDPPATPWMAAATIAACLAVFCLVLLSARWVWHNRPMGFLGAWFFLILAPSSSVVPLLSQVAAEKRMYLPLAAVVVLIAVAISRAASRLPSPSNTKAALATAAVLTLLCLTIARTQEYRDPVGLWEGNIAATPTNARAYDELGTTLVKRGDAEEAVACFRRAVELRPGLA